ncbi:uncharacterized protein LOC111355681 [Spodoptera litura]|uniref:Uncharacterized protein LOC111355681 n=1 Tax=Spodoptera litura TaxID=69820 RepID=A0A9J7EDC9_SPOLT|nr:uncharacterized protein LOC111355681 [Spodoptera litura]
MLQHSAQAVNMHKLYKPKLWSHNETTTEDIGDCNTCKDIQGRKERKPRDRGRENLEKLIIVGNTEGKARVAWTFSNEMDRSSKRLVLICTAVRDALDRIRWKQIIRSRCSSDAAHDPHV